MIKEYGNTYLRWKKWGQQKFAVLKNSQACYFSSEISRLKQKIPVGAKVLEIGFGNGAFLQYAQQRKWDVYGTEINNELVEIAKQSGFNVRYSENVASFTDNTFDLVLAFDVLEHIPQDTLVGFLLEVKRILKNEGFFIARFPNGDSPFGLKIQNGDVTHITSIGSGKVYYLGAETNMKVFFIGGEAEPILGLTVLPFFHRIIFLPIKKLLNVLVNLAFFPLDNIEFFSSNVTVIYKKVQGNLD
jgi:2-polyprenyl-3-methyl-5-hydroxy-6-metoxy-1,4-benzoquinol methylase